MKEIRCFMCADKFTIIVRHGKNYGIVDSLIMIDLEYDIDLIFGVNVAGGLWFNDYDS